MTWCWWCCHEFDTLPLKLPHKHDELRNIFYTSGNFCSWSCMKAFAIDKYGDNHGSIICGNIVVMRKKLFNKIGPIKKAPDRFKLNVFGGDMTIEEFRLNANVDKELVENTVEEKPVPQIVIPFVSNTKKMNEIKNSSMTNNALKLKRNKPLQRNHNNLESALGLVIKS